MVRPTDNIVSDETKSDITRLLSLGTEAKKKQYHTMLTRVSHGEILSAGELKAFDTLDRELRALGDGAQPPGTDAGPTLPNLLAVVDHLQRLGWKVKKSAAYKHRAEGKIRPTKTGSYLIVDVDRYAAAHLRKLDGTAPAPQLDDLQTKKAALETRHMEAKVTHQELKNEILLGKFVPKDLFERALAARAAVFKTDIENFARGQAPGIVAMVDGDLQKVPELVDFILAEGETWLARYSESQEFSISPEDYARILASQTDDDVSRDDDDDEAAAQAMHSPTSGAEAML
jgi:hypothetical protein